MGWLSSLWHAIQPAVTPLAVLISAWLHGKVTSTPSDAARAAHLAQLAEDTVALALKMFPSLANNYGALLKQVVNMLSAIAGVPTTNPTVLERAAAGALARAGKFPPAS